MGPLDMTGMIPEHGLELWLVALLVCIGHVSLHVEALNWFLGLPTSQPFAKKVRKADTVLLFAGLGLAVWMALVGKTNFVNVWPSWVWSLFVVYGYLCVGFALFVTPVTLVRYWMRGQSPALVSNHSEVVDFNKETGHSLYGAGNHKTLALLPGNQICTVEYNEKYLRLPNLPEAFDGLTLLHLTDLHFHGVPAREFYESAIQRCVEKWQPDLVAVTGDIVDSKEHHAWIEPVFARLSWNAAGFAIVGNHDQLYDPDGVRQQFERLGYGVLGNSWQQIEIRGEPMIVIGHEGPWFRPAADLSRCPEEPFRLCLSHTPDNIFWAKERQIDLVLSGHNHGGQIRFPVFGSMYVPSRYSRRYDCGTFQEGKTVIHVSRGISGQYPLRWNCRPEITLLVLQRAEIE